MDIKLSILSLFTGLACGLVFGYFRLPLLAPGVFEAVFGIVGIYVGGRLIAHIIGG